MDRKATKRDKEKRGRRRPAAKDLPTAKGRAVKGGAVQSPHVGGMQVALGDGSVRFVSPSVGVSRAVDPNNPH
jgi:hypothetical protein